MLVKDVMITRVKTVNPDSAIRDVATMLGFYHISGLPVVTDGDTLVGVISEKDVLRAMYPKIDEAIELSSSVHFDDLESEFRDVLHAHVSDFMTAHVFTVAPDDQILRAVAVMIAHKIRRIPVASNGKLVGILSIGDVHKAVLKETFDRKLGQEGSKKDLHPRV
ncbi:MAG TPA: CBS domain-containing protein [Acidiferrobacter sp.]|nr:CBS domain-containing protein [Acidiferrobacter sp.]